MELECPLYLNYTRAIKAVQYTLLLFFALECNWRIIENMKYSLLFVILAAVLLSGCSNGSSKQTGQSLVSTQAAQLTATAMYAGGSAASPSIGMTPDQVLTLWGYPEEIHQDDVYGEQWIYPNNVSIYFKNGTVSKIQN
jgi:hypothetical protein